MDVVGIGALNFDRLFKVEKIAGGGEEVFVKEVFEAPGGSSANTIVALAKLGIRTGFIGRIGNDSEGKFILRDMRREGVDTTCIKKVKGSTGLILGFVNEEGERALYAYPGVNDSLRITKPELDYAKKAKFLHLSSFVGEISYNAQKELLEKIPGVKISFSPGMLYARKGLKKVKQLIEKSYVIFLNSKEVRLLTGRNYKEGAEKLLAAGAEIVGITLGKNGSYIASENESYKIKASSTEVVDTTGAGDAFAAGFLYGLLKEKNLETCGKLGAFLAAKCIQKMGARAGLPYIKEVEDEIV